MPINNKKYDGIGVVEHVIQPGQSLAKIAKLYGHADHRAIWAYNTKVRPVLRSTSPDLIPTGRRILIPRSKAGYDKWLAQIEALKNDAKDIVAEAKLDEIEAKAGQWDVALDFVSDFVTLFATLAVKGTQAAKSAGAAFDRSLIDEGVLNQRLGFAQHFTEAEGALFHVMEKMDAMWTAARSKVRGALGEKLADKLLGSEFALARKVLKAVWLKNPATAKVCLEAVADCAKAVFEFSEYAKPSGMRSLMMLYFTGSTLAGTIEEQRRALKASEERIRAQMDADLKRIRAEKAVVWGVE